MSADIAPAAAAGGPGGTCRGCAFWQADGPVRGFCRVLAPLVVRFGQEVESVWPTTLPDDWCGQHRPRLPAGVRAPLRDYPPGGQAPPPVPFMWDGYRQMADSMAGGGA
jgi:hypothetical protein